VSFLCNILLLFRIIPTPSPFDVTIVQRLTLLIAIILTASMPGFADTIALPTVGQNSTSDLVSATGVVSTEAADTSVLAIDSEPATASDEVGTDASVECQSADATCSTTGPIQSCPDSNGAGLHDKNLDRLWLVSTRSLTSEACRANLTTPGFQVSQLDHCGNARHACVENLLDLREDNRPVLIQVHGNRMTSDSALDRGLFVYHNTAIHADARPIDFIIFSWPSERVGMLLTDGREKAERTDAEGLYLAWLVRELINRDTPVAIIGFSFGGRVATGAMHAMAGGKLGGRSLPGDHVRGAEVSVGLIAPALEDDWLRSGQYHGMATQNIRQLSILYNRRDAVLKRYWLIDTVRGSMALGFTGPKGVAPRFDGSPMPVTSRDCSPSLGIRHDEKEYYQQSCRAGKQMAKLLESTL
jgi:hypothetical protein